nr:acyltransferase family protein [Salipaludibacillus aurantiacus]
MGCLAVTLGHAFYSGYIVFYENTLYHSATYVLYMMMLFGMPVFVFLSEFLLANKYSNTLPKGFMKKRVKILLLPFLFMNVVYVILYLEIWTIQNFTISLLENVFLGKSSVYFILIIFQFYLLHKFFSKYLDVMSPKLIIPTAFLINFVYLAFFNFNLLEPPNNNFASYFWHIGYRVPFVGWLFYFVLGYYSAKSYHKILSKLSFKWLAVIAFCSFIVIFINNSTFQLQYISQRLDMLLYAGSMIFLIIYFSNRIRNVPKVVVMISNYSFNIYLLNVLFITLFRYIEPPPFFNLLTYSFAVFLLTIFFSILTGYLFNRFKLGPYLVGRVMPFKVESRVGKKGIKKLAM